jgi:hypothetical protein
MAETTDYFLDLKRLEFLRLSVTTGADSLCRDGKKKAEKILP